MAPIERTNRFNVMLSDRELEMLRELAEERGVTNAVVIRDLVREAFKVAFGDDGAALIRKKKR
ncbi:MAG: ribbon-helix-helix protein, CopG family [Labilithrix sp.]